MPEQTPTIVLVHGAWADAAGWEKVTLRLQEGGFTVYARPTCCADCRKTPPICMTFSPTTRPRPGSRSFWSGTPTAGRRAVMGDLRAGRPGVLAAGGDLQGNDISEVSTDAAGPAVWSR